MSRYAIHADKFVLPSGIGVGGYLIVEDGIFGWYQQHKPEDVEIKEFPGAWIAPGLVDTHIHGFVGQDVMDCSWEADDKMCKGLVKYGITSWTPTTLTASYEQLLDACRAIGDHIEDNSEGARIQGIFLEGPFFTEKHKGAQNPAYFGDPKIEWLNDWQQAAGGLVCKIAIAPERNGAPEFTAEATENGVAVALAHSDSSFEQASRCVDAGASIFVHTYNGMSGLHHREPGMVGAAFVTKNSYAEAICDGHHMSPIAFRALVQAKGVERVVLISDCMRAGGMPDGDYTLGEFPVRVENGAARLTDESKSLAGSVLTLDVAIRNVVEWGACTAEEAFRMATENAARSALIEDVCGYIKPGRDADFVVFDKDLKLKEVFMSGESVHKA